MGQRHHPVRGGDHRLHGVEIDPAVRGERHDVDGGSDLLRRDLPGDDVAVMLQHGEQDAVAGLELRARPALRDEVDRSEEHTSELQSLMRISYAVFCLKKKTITTKR